MREEDVAYANALLPDYIGFVFVKDRRRYVPPEKAALMKAHLAPDITAVGVFVDETIETILAIAEANIIDAIQLHGHEKESYIVELKNRITKPIIKAFRIDTSADIQRANASSADLVLLDNGGGGTGKTFDWSLIDGIDRPFILAGGLSGANIEEALGACHPFAVDISSGVETDGKKDYNKMKAFIDAVRKR